tara:strand:- start:1078 stop:1428 length:351 start_codon:yes stop_codon:yes gene_type:complete
MAYRKKIPESEREIIYKEFLTGIISISELAHRYNVSQRHISTIITNKMQYNEYQKMVYNLKVKPKTKRTEQVLYSLFYNGQNVVIGSKYGICAGKRKELIRQSWNRKLFSIKPHKL